MILRAQSLALFVLMALSTALQGTAFLQCLCSGRVVIAAFGTAECRDERADEAPHCQNCARRAAADDSFRALDCWRVLDFGGGETQQAGAVVEVSTLAPSEFQESVIDMVPPRGFACREPIPRRPPDPPGPPLTILYASLLV